MPRSATAASVLVDHMPPPPDGPPPADRITYDILKNYVELERMTYTSDLVVAGARPEHLETQPLAVLIVGVRGDKGEPFGLHVLQALNPFYTIGRLLASPLGEQITQELAAFMHLDANALKSGGLTADDVRTVGWPISRWFHVFGVGVDFLLDLGMKRREFAMDDAEALSTAGLSLDEGDGTNEPALFKIEL
jgi:hypothetical protein